MPVSNPGNPSQTFFPTPTPPTPGAPDQNSPQTGINFQQASTEGAPAKPGAMSSRAVKVVGFVIAGAALVALADVAPEAGIGLTAVLGLGVLIAHSSELVQLTNGFSAALGQPQTA